MILTFSSSEMFSFIEQNWKVFMIDQIKRCKIISEFDFQAAFYNLIINKIEEVSDDTWRIYNMYYLRRKKMYPDLLLFQNNLPIICIEFKNYLFQEQSDKKIQIDVSKLNNIFKAYPDTMKYGISINLLKRPIKFNIKKGIYGKNIHIFNLIINELPDLINNWNEVLKELEISHDNIEKARKSLLS